MRIAVMGAGGTGGYFGGLLAQSGEDVTFIARGEHLKAIQRNGLHIESVHGDFTIHPAKATDDPSTIGPVDAVFFAIKTWDIEDAAQKLRPVLKPDTVILPVQNGVDASERVAAVLGEQYVLGGTCHIVSLVAEPGLIRQKSPFRRIALGEINGSITPRVQTLANVLQRAGAEVIISDNINKARWTKFLFIASFSGVGAVTRVPAGELRSCPETRQMLESAMREVAALAMANGVPLDASVVDETMDFVDNLPVDSTASMQRDILEGKPSELESQNGYIARHGVELGVPVPTNQFIYAALLPQERRARDGVV